MSFMKIILALILLSPFLSLSTGIAQTDSTTTSSHLWSLEQRFGVLPDRPLYGLELQRRIHPDIHFDMGFRVSPFSIYTGLTLHPPSLFSVQLQAGYLDHALPGNSDAPTFEVDLYAALRWGIQHQWENGIGFSLGIAAAWFIDLDYTIHYDFSSAGRSPEQSVNTIICPILDLGISTDI